METEKAMRTVSRFIDLLRKINLNGPMTVGDMVAASGMPYATTSRIVKTMLHHELIDREPGTKLFRVTANALSLSNGFQHGSRLATAARPTIEALTERIGWPVAVMTRVGASMVAQASTHHLTSLTFGPCPNGTAIPIEHSASGHAYLAHASSAERAGIIDGLQKLKPCSPIMALLVEGRHLDRIRYEGFATLERNPYNNHPGKTSSISVAIHHAGVLQGVLTLVFFSSAMTTSEALRRYLRDLQQAAVAIGAAMDHIRAPAATSGLEKATSGKPALSSPASTVRASTQGATRYRDAALAFSKLISNEQRQAISSPAAVVTRRSC